MEAGNFAASVSLSRMRAVRVSSSVLGCEELEIWVCTALSSQKAHELEQGCNNNFDRALTFD